MSDSGDFVYRSSKGHQLMCLSCIVADQLDGEAGHAMHFVGDLYAVTIRNGEALCMPHFNVVRGWPRNYGDKKDPA